MRKVWVTKRKGIPGQYVEWYDDSGRRRSKYFRPEFKKYITSFKTRKWRPFVHIGKRAATFAFSRFKTCRL